MTVFLYISAYYFYYTRYEFTINENNGYTFYFSFMSMACTRIHKKQIPPIHPELKYFNPNIPFT